MPFGISSAAEHFQRRMSEILAGLPGVVCLMDDILIYGKDKKQHGINLATALDRIQSAKVTLNKEKCEFGKTSIRFLGHIINGEGVSADPRKTAAIQETRTPQSIPKLRRFLGMDNQLGKFSPVMAELTKPLRELLSKKSSWLWGPSQAEAFRKIKLKLASPPVLTWYDPSADTRIAVDASSYGLGAVLLQTQRGKWKPAAYASRSLTETETRYAQIDKEALATTWACERFSNYILGKSVSIETDHKPLVPLLNTKHLDSLPPRVLQFRLRLARFNYTVEHVPGKLLFTADTLSRAPLESSQADHSQAKAFEAHVSVIMSQLLADKDRLKAYSKAQADDPVCSQLIHFCHNGWPE